MGSLHVTGRRPNHSGRQTAVPKHDGRLSIAMDAALGPRLQLKAGFFARRPKRRSFKHRSEIAWPIHTDRRFF